MTATEQLGLFDAPVARSSNSVDPMVGQRIHLCDAHTIDTDKYRLNWRSDNTARVTLREVDTTGMVRCSKAGTCMAAEFCAFGKPHLPEEADTEWQETRCWDHKPYVVGGVLVHATTCEANKAISKHDH